MSNRYTADMSYLYRRITRLLAILMVFSVITSPLWADTADSEFPAHSMAKPSFNLPGVAEMPEQPRRSKALRRYLSDGNFSQAQRICRDATKAKPDSVAAHYNQGLVHYRQQKLEPALASLQKAVKLAERSGNFRDPRLSKPLFALGILYNLLEQYDLAVAALERAAFIERTQYGLKSLEQLAHDDALIDSLLASAKIGAAYQRLQVQLSVLEQHSGQGIELDSQRSAVAKKLHTMGLHQQALQLQEQRLRDANNNNNNNNSDPQILADIHQGIAIAYRYLYDPRKDDQPSTTGTKAPRVYYTNNGVVLVRERPAPFEKLNTLNSPRHQGNFHLKQAQKQQRKAEASDAERAATLVLLGDHYAATDQRRSARVQYKKAYKLLSEASLSEEIQQTFSQPQLVYQPVLKGSVSGDTEKRLGYIGRGYVRADIDKNGRAKNIELLRIEPDSAQHLSSRLNRMARKSIFRPQYDDKGPVKTENAEFILHFQFLPKAN